jgi:hypothetical protein
MGPITTVLNPVEVEQPSDVLGCRIKSDSKHCGLCLRCKTCNWLRLTNDGNRPSVEMEKWLSLYFRSSELTQCI